VALYGCETGSLTLREERRLRVFENRVLRKVFGPKRDEGTGEWRKLHNEELNDLYYLPNIVRVVKSRRMRWTGHVAHMGEDRVVHRVLVGKPEGKRPLGRPRCRWEDNIKIDLQEVGGGRGDWMELAQNRNRWRALVGTVRDFGVPVALPPGKRTVPLYRRLGGPKSRSGRVGKISPPTGIRSPDRPARNESLC